MEQSLRTVYIYGRLRKLAGVDKLELSGDTLRELVLGVSATIKSCLPKGQAIPRFACKIKGVSEAHELDLKLEDDDTEFHLYPTLMGSGGENGVNWFQIILGVILIIVGVVFFAFGGYAAIAAGIGLIISGVIGLLYPAPEIDLKKTEDIEASKYLGANGNTVKIGTPIPLVFGRIKNYGHYISFNVDAVDVAI